jgi:hypothetical protein
MKEVFVLVANFNGKLVILDKCLASSIKQAQSIFDGEWVIGEAMSEVDLISEIELNSYESANC